MSNNSEPCYLKTIYCGMETWETTKEKTLHWAQTLLSEHFGLSEQITSKSEVRITELKDSSGVEMRVGIDNIKLKDEHNLLFFLFELDSRKPGHVMVLSWERTAGPFNPQDAHNDMYFLLPLMDLSGFESLNEATDWLEANPDFYKWDRFMEKVHP